MSARVRTIWVDARRFEEHVHVRVHMGWSYGQEDMPDLTGYGPGVRDDAGDAGTLILRDYEREWQPWIRVLARGGHATNVRVLWCEHTDDRRSLWNAHADAPAIVGTTEPVPWERDTSKD